MHKSQHDFFKDKSHRSGYRNQCYRRDYHKKNFKVIKKRVHKWYLKNKRRIKKNYLKNYESISDKVKIWRFNNPEVVKKCTARWMMKNRKRMKIWRKQYRKRKSKSNPLYKLSETLRVLTVQAFRRIRVDKVFKTEYILGANWRVVKKHIELQFTKGMDWSNHGKWHIHHIITLASAKTKEELYVLCRYVNLKPLWAEDHRKIHGKK